jgi:hypothetical protein
MRPYYIYIEICNSNIMTADRIHKLADHGLAVHGLDLCFDGVTNCAIFKTLFSTV